MPGRDRAKGAGVVVEACSVVKPTGFRCGFTESPDAFIAVEEPPWRAELKSRIGAR